MTDFGAIHELTLVREVLALIERYYNAHGLATSPDAVRDTMLNVASLLHVEAARLANKNRDQKQLEETFLDKARECLAEVGDVSGESGRSLQ